MKYWTKAELVRHLETDHPSAVAKRLVARHWTKGSLTDLHDGIHRAAADRTARLNAAQTGTYRAGE